MGHGRFACIYVNNVGNHSHFMIGRDNKIPKSRLENFVRSCGLCYNDSEIVWLSAVGKRRICNDSQFKELKRGIGNSI
jgi:hypothetical protein